jgi:hypothetical protein
MKIDSKFIKQWEPKYDEIESDQSEYLSLIKRVNEEVRTNISISLETFERIINWKSRRAKAAIKWDAYSIYRETFRKILDPEYPAKMKLLVALPGIGAPVASTILHFIFPDIFPIYDTRTVEVLNDFCYLKRKTVSPSHYPEFQDAMLKIRTENVHYDLRQIDRALFAYHKVSSGKPGKATSRDEKCRTSKRSKTKETSKPSVKGLIKSKLNASIPAIVEAICEELGAGGREIRRKDIISKTKEYGIKESSVLPADYCDNTPTGQWSLLRFKSRNG